MVWGENAGFPYLFHLFIIFVYMQWNSNDVVIHISNSSYYFYILPTSNGSTKRPYYPILHVVLIIFSADRYDNNIYCWSWINTTGIPVTPAFGYRYTQFQWLILKYLLYFEFAVSFFNFIVIPFLFPFRRNTNFSQ